MRLLRAQVISCGTGVICEFLHPSPLMSGGGVLGFRI